MHYIDVQRFDHSSANISVDGRVDEPIWSKVAAHDNMKLSIPGTGEPAPLRTDIRLFGTEKGIYISAVMHQPRDTLVRRLTNRDEFIDRDNFGVTLDTTGTGKFAYWFIVALGDSLMDGKVLPERRYSNDWDGPWISKTQEVAEGWSVEMFMPWSMMALANVPGKRDIGFAFSRTVSHYNERYQWPGHSQSSPQFVSALNTLQIEGVKPRKLISVIPYASATVDEARQDDDVRVGADITWKPTPAFEVTAALNPDFGAVEADDVVVNLTALETFFPEKRLFFLEGNEVFETNNRSSSGNNMRIYNAENFATTSRRVFVTDNLPPPISILNTRRIGGTATQAVLPPNVTPARGETDRPTDLLGAAKFTGAVGNFRYGVMSAFEDDVEWIVRDTADREFTLDNDGRDFGVVRALYETTTDNRFSVGYLGTHVAGPVYDATVHSADAHFSSPDGRWGADLQLIRSDVDDISGNGALLDLSFRPDSNNRHTVRLDYMDEEVDISDLGFLRRSDYGAAQYIYTYAQPQPMGFIKTNRGAITLDQRYNISKGQIVDSGIYWRNTATLPGRNTLRTALAYFPERYEDIDSRGNGAYRVDPRVWWDLLLTTNASKLLSFSLGVGGWQEHLGDWTYQLQAGATFRPTDTFNAQFDVKYKHRDGWLVYQGSNNFGAYRGTDWQPSLKFNWFLAPAHQIRFSLQWAGVRVDEEGFFAVPIGDGDLIPAGRTLPSHDFTVSLLTAQLRYRWEIAPLTDLFVVYNRGNTLSSRAHEPFEDLFTNSFEDPVVDALIIKLRYRFSN